MTITPGFPTLDVGRQSVIKLTPKTDYDDSHMVYTPIYVSSAVFGAVFIFAPFCVPKGPNRGITRCCIMLTAFCLWIFWVTVYIAQINPLLGPRLHNTSMAWVGHQWGRDPKSLGGEEEKK